MSVAAKHMAGRLARKDAAVPLLHVFQLAARRQYLLPGDKALCGFIYPIAGHHQPYVVGGTGCVVCAEFDAKGGS